MEIVCLEQLPRGYYLSRVLAKHGIGGAAECRKLPSTATKAERLAAHRTKMEFKKLVRSRR